MDIWNRSEETDEKQFVLDRYTGKVTIKSSGTYVIYVKVTFIEQRAFPYSFGLILNDYEKTPLVQCNTGIKLRKENKEGMEGTFASCDIEDVRYLEEGTQLSVGYIAKGIGFDNDKNVGPRIYISKDATSFGLVKLSWFTQ